MAEFFAGKDWQTFLQILPTIPFETWETVWSTVVATLLALVIGLPLGVLLVTGEPNGIRPLPKLGHGAAERPDQPAAQCAVPDPDDYRHPAVPFDRGHIHRHRSFHRAAGHCVLPVRLPSDRDQHTRGRPRRHRGRPEHGRYTFADHQPR